MLDRMFEIFDRNRRDEMAGLASVCSANRFVVEAALEHARKRNLLACLESTGRQVNQYGGYEGMMPKQFAEFVRRAAEIVELPRDRVVLGADHLGPGPWQSEDSESAMAKARELVRQCVLAGYRKLHLDPSAPCRDDVRDGLPHVSAETISERTASLCESAEDAAKAVPGAGARLVYVVGTDVPAPGGQQDDDLETQASSAADAEETMIHMRRAFAKKGLESAWKRCVAIVVRTGATFGPETVRDYDNKRTEDLKAWIRDAEKLVFEAHSTDFQTEEALTEMVKDHFAILKVGPCLTFAMREALFALAHIERELLGERRGAVLSRLPEVVRNTMVNDRTHWRRHYRGDPSRVRYISVYGFSDRIRYYWSVPRIEEAVAILFQNMDRYGIPLPLLSQYMPSQYEAVRQGRIRFAPKCLVKCKIMEILDRYAGACRGSLGQAM